MQTVGVQVVGLEIGGGDKTHTIGKQGVQQAVQDHRVGDVCYVELIETDEFVALRDTPPQLVQRVHRALQVGQLAVHFPHELVEMQARLAPDRHGVEEAVHQEALAPPDTAIHVDTTRHIGPVDELFQRIGALRFIGRPLGGAAVQRVHCTQLCGVALETTGGQLRLVGVFDVHGIICYELDSILRPASGRKRPFSFKFH